MRDEEEEQLKLAIAGRLQEMCDALILNDPKLTEGAIGGILGVADPDTFSTYVTGKRKTPYRVLAAAQREFGATFDWFFNGDARYNSPAFEVMRLAFRRAPPQKPRRGKRRNHRD